MAAMEPDSIDAVCTDPPYGLEFMGKEWDRLGDGFRRQGNPADIGRADVFGRTTRTSPEYRAGAKAQSFHQRWATEAFRIAKPGAYLLAFGGTRTYHRMTCAIEDAGWIIRDCLVWAYASGFPKSRALLKPAWEPIVMARKPGPLRELAIDACRIASEPWQAHDATGLASVKYFSEGDAPVIHKEPHDGGRWPANLILTDPIFDGDTTGVVGGGMASPGTAAGVKGSSGFAQGYDGEYTVPYGDTGTYSSFFTIPQGTMCEWCGASSAEVSFDRRRSLDGSALSPARTEASSAVTIRTASATTSGIEQTSWHDSNGSTSRSTRWPGSQPDELSRSSPASPAAPNGTSSATTTTTRDRWMCASCVEPAMRSSMAAQESAERNYAWAYLIPKADRAEREPVLGGLPLRPNEHLGQFVEGHVSERGNRVGHYKERSNHHPTVKPLDLMRHLVRLVTPTGGLVLDPFLGSGTTALAAEMEGFRWVGIEKEPEYVAIAEARLNGTQRGLGLEV